MTSADIASRILNWQSASYVSSQMLDDTPLSELVQQHHDAVVEECARVAERLVQTDPPRLLAFARAAREIRALKGCA